MIRYDRRVRWMWVLALVLSACGHAKPRTGVLTDELIPHIAELGREGQAQIPTVIEKGGSRKPGETQAVALDQPVRFKGTSTSLVLLLAGCPPFTGNVPCPIKRHDTDLVYLLPNGLGKYKEEWVRPEEEDEGMGIGTVSGILSLTSFGGMGLCIAYCESYRTEKSMALGGAGLLFGLIWLLSSGDVHD